jgi:2-aminoadipate transaminase
MLFLHQEILSNMIEPHLQLFHPFGISKGNGPVYKQLALFIEGLILSHILPPGERLPSERALAALLGLSRTTVTAAYEEVIAMGLTVTHVGKGTFVEPLQQDVTNLVPPPPPWAQPPPVLLDHLLTASTFPLSHEQRLISFAAGMPAPEALPEALDEIIHHIVTSDPAGAFGVTPAAGLPELRKQLALWMMPSTLIRAETREEVVVTTGAQQALDLVARFFLHPGDTVLVERPTALGALQLFKAYGAHVLDSDLVHLVLPPQQQKPRFFYVLPTWQNPSGRCLNYEERLALLRFSARYALPLVEDDPYGPIWFDAPPPPSLWKLASSVPGAIVISLGTVSKILATGLRLGWLRSPQPYATAFAQLKQTADLHTNTLAQWIVLEYLTTQRLEHHLTRIRPLYRERCQAMLKAIERYLPTLSCQVPGGGFYLWCTLKGIKSLDLYFVALQHGVTFLPGPSCYVDEKENEWLRLSFAAHAREDTEEGIRRLARAVANLQAEKARKQA